MCSRACSTPRPIWICGGCPNCSAASSARSGAARHCIPSPARRRRGRVRRRSACWRPPLASNSTRRAAKSACATRGCRHSSTTWCCAICTSDRQASISGFAVTATMYRWKCCVPAAGFRCRSFWRIEFSQSGGSMRANRHVAIIAIALAGFLTASRAQNDAAPAPQKEPAPPPSVTVIGARDAHGVLGRDVRSAADEDMGRIVDVIVDRGGQVRAAVIDFGGFLGVGSRKIVVDWNALHFGRIANKRDSITLELTKEQVTAAPEYKEDTPIVVLGASGSLQPLQFTP